MIVSRETRETLDKYIDLILAWNDRINLISRKSISKDFLNAQVADCLQLMDFLEDKEGLLVDIGSGSGLPAAILSIAGMQKCNLVEINHKKVAFLRFAKNHLKLNFNVINMSIEDVQLNEKVRYITSKAYGTLALMARQAQHIMDENTQIITLKSREQVQAELDELTKEWTYQLNLVDNQYNNGYVVIISNLKRLHE